MTEKQFLIKLHMKKYKDKWDTCEFCGTKSDIRVSTKKKKIKWSCNHYSSPLRGTFLHKTSIEISKFLELLRVFLDSKHGISSTAAGKILGKSQPTGWKILKLIRENIEDITFEDDDVIQIGEFFLKSTKRYSRKQNIPKDELVEHGKIIDRKQVKTKDDKELESKSKVILCIRGSNGAYHSKYIKINASNMEELRNSSNGEQFYGEWKKLLKKIDITNKKVFHNGDFIISEIIKELGGHPFVVKHNKTEYIETDNKEKIAITTNAINGYFGRFNLTFKGIYSFATDNYMQEYLDEYNFKSTFREDLSKRFIEKIFTED